ncbi:MAG: hypothetical protein RPS47_15945 [Colwellia sp.]
MSFKLFVSIFLLSSVTQANEPGNFTGKIKSILAGPGHGGSLYISVVGTVTPQVSGGVVCTTDPLHSFVIDTNNALSATWVSMLLTAYAADKYVYLQGTGICPNTVESLNQIRLK